MSLDDRTVAIYSALDSVTLLALLPTLRYEAERTKAETDTFERVRLGIPEQSWGMAGEVSITRDRRPDESASKHEEQMRWARDRPDSDGDLGQVLERLEQHRADLVARERWILGELVRRGLLPAYPYWGERRL
jgi:hypothetical protein